MILKKLKSINKQTKIVITIIVINFIILSIIAHFRFAIYDEKLYLHETVMMSEVIKQGKWIGNFGVGVHGFIFKLPIALLFIITGPSIYLATIFHIFLASITVWIFYLILIKNIKIKKWSILILLLFISNYSFFSWSLTFHREIPVIFSLILFTYNLINKNKKILLNSLLLLLVFEAKEYVFFTILPPLFIYLLFINKKFLKTIKNFFLLLLPSLIYLYLMFNSSIMPVNMFNASLLGFTKNSFSYQIKNTLPQQTLSDLSTYSNYNISFSLYKEVSEIKLYNNGVPQTNLFKKALTILLFISGYLEKLFYVSTFSFQGIPIIILIPSLITSIFLFKKWKYKRPELLFLNLFYWFYLFIYIIRTSHQRYILPIIPFNLIFFYFFLELTLQKYQQFKPYFKKILCFSSATTLITLLYQNIDDNKHFFNIFSTLIILSLYFLLFYKRKYKNVLMILIVTSVLVFSLFINIYSMSTKNQIYKSNLWGINGEADKIAQLVKPEDIIFIDCKSGSNSEFTYLVNIFRKNNYLPIEWHWKLDKKKINRELDQISTKPNFYYNISLENFRKFEINIKENNINKIILLKSEIKDEKFPLEEYIEILKNEKWVKLDKIEQLKNKELYIFSVKK